MCIKDRAGPDHAEWLARVGLLGQRLDRAARRALERRVQRLDELAGRLWRRHPSQPIRSRARHLIELDRRLRKALAEWLNRERHGLAGLAARLQARTPQARLRLERQRLRSLALRLLSLIHI